MLVLLYAISVAHDESNNSLLEGVGNPILTGWSLLINDHSQLSLVKLTYNTKATGTKVMYSLNIHTDFIDTRTIHVTEKFL